MGRSTRSPIQRQYTLGCLKRRSLPGSFPAGKLFAGYINFQASPGDVHRNAVTVTYKSKWSTVIGLR
jgi:hypothetical protein